MSEVKIKKISEELLPAYNEISEEQDQLIDDLRCKANDFLKILEFVPNCRRKSIAITHLEEAVMFASKAICFGN